jgi:PAS domain-containing protein
MSQLPPQSWLDGLLEAVWLVDGNSLRILQANKAAEQLAGRSATDMVGKLVTCLTATPQDHAFWAEPFATLSDGIRSHTSM